MCHINTVRNRINSAAVLPYMKEEAGGMHRGKPCAAPCERRIGAIVRFSQMVGYWAAFGLQMVGYWAAFGTVKVNSQPLLSSSRLFQQRSLSLVSLTFRPNQAVGFSVCVCHIQKWSLAIALRVATRRFPRRFPRRKNSLSPKGTVKSEQKIARAGAAAPCRRAPQGGRGFKGGGSCASGGLAGALDEPRPGGRRMMLQRARSAYVLSTH